MKRKAVEQHRPNSRHDAAAVLAVCPYGECGEQLPTKQHLNRCGMLDQLRVRNEEDKRVRLLVNADRVLAGQSMAAIVQSLGSELEGAGPSYEVANPEVAALRAWVDSMTAVVEPPLFTPAPVIPVTVEHLQYLNRQLGDIQNGSTLSAELSVPLTPSGDAIDSLHDDGGGFDFAAWGRAQRAGFALLNRKPVPRSALASSHPGIPASLALPASSFYERQDHPGLNPMPFIQTEPPASAARETVLPAQTPDAYYADTATLTYSQRSSFLAQFFGTDFPVVQGLETYDRSSIAADIGNELGLQEKHRSFEVDLLLRLRLYNTVSIHHWRRGAICSEVGELPLRYTRTPARLPLHISDMLPRANQSVLLRSSHEWIEMHYAVPRTVSDALTSCARAAELLKAAKADNAFM